MNLIRAYTQLDIKAAEQSNGKRIFRGVASTPTTDSYGDIVESQGAEADMPLPFLWMHDSRDPIGWITAYRASKTQIEVDGEVADIPEEGELKQRLEMAWQYLKNKLVRGLSIGFNPIESARIDGTYGIHYMRWRWLELSAVTIPANMDASITAIKSIDTKLRAASGHLMQRRAPALARSPLARGTSLPVGKPGGFIGIPS